MMLPFSSVPRREWRTGTMLVLLLLFLLVHASPQITVNYTLIVHNQLNTPSAPAAFNNKLVCYNFTDPPRPLLQAADDFVIPSTTSNCFALQLALTTIRVKHNQNPQSLTVQLMYNDDVTNGPGAVFFTTVLRSPPLLWNDALLGKPLNLLINFTQGDLDASDGVTRFNLSNSSFLPPLKRLWVSFYGTGPRNFLFSGYEENDLFWVTFRNDSIPLLQGGQLANRDYYFVDRTNVLRDGFVRWTDATQVETLLGIDSGTLNLAFSVSLLCAQTVSVTGVPTASTSAPPPPSSISGAPTAAPSAAPTFGNWTNTTHIGGVELTTRNILLAVLLPLSLLLCCLCFCCYKRRAKFRQLQQKHARSLVALNSAHSQPSNETLANGSAQLWTDGHRSEVELDELSHVWLDPHSDAPLIPIDSTTTTTTTTTAPSDAQRREMAQRYLKGLRKND